MGLERPVTHGRDHRLTGPDPASLSVDSTATASTGAYDQGVHSAGADAGDLLQADGSDGSLWGPFGIAAPVEYLDASITGLGAGPSGGDLTWSHSSGVTLLNLVTPGPTVPVFIDAGIYLIAGVMLTLEDVQAGRNVFHTIAQASSVPLWGTADSFTADATADHPASLGISLAGFFNSGDQMRLHAVNNDSISHDFSCTNIKITKIA